jgi:AcrR family transcriptional regulator
MPRRVDTAERRANIADAVLRIAATRGLEEVSLRDVAAEAGISMGQVQHYFASRSEMLHFACAYMVERTRNAIAAQIASAPQPATARAALRATLAQFLPIDSERQEGTWVWLAFLARGGYDRAVVEAMRSTWHSSHDYFASQLRWARETGELPPDRDPDEEAVTLLAFADGMTSHVLVGHYDSATALAAIDRCLDRLLIPSSDTPDN